MTAEEVNAIFSILDINKDGKLDYSEVSLYIYLQVSGNFYCYSPLSWFVYTIYITFFQVVCVQVCNRHILNKLVWTLIFSYLNI